MVEKKKINTKTEWKYVKCFTKNYSKLSKRNYYTR